MYKRQVQDALGDAAQELLDSCAVDSGPVALNGSGVAGITSGSNVERESGKYTG